MFLSNLASVLLLFSVIPSSKIFNGFVAGAADTPDGTLTIGEAEQSTLDMIAWIRSSGGTVSEKIEIRLPYDVGKDGNFRGIYAREAFEKGEVVCDLPWDLLVKPGPGEGDCATTYGIYDAMKDPRNPYGRYLNTQPRRYVPSWWSAEGKALLTEMLGEDLPPFEWDQYVQGLEDECGRQPRYKQLMKEDPEQLLHAEMLVIARADGALMVPFYDMFNHRNGKWYNTNHDSDHGRRFRIITNRKVEAGEQLQQSYNQCNICANRADVFGTDEMFKDYGFVEFMPQRWVVDEVRVKFDIDDREDGSGLEVKFLAPISHRGLAYFRKELSRLEYFETKYRNDARTEATVPAGEWFALWQYHDAVATAFDLALKTGKDRASDKVWNMGDRWNLPSKYAHKYFDEEEEDEDDWSEDGASWDEEFEEAKKRVMEESGEEEGSSWDEDFEENDEL